MDLVLLLVAFVAVFGWVQRDRIATTSARRRVLRRLDDGPDPHDTPRRAVAQRPNIRAVLSRPTKARTAPVPETLACADFLDNVERNVRLGRSLRAGILEAHGHLSAGSLRDALEHTVLYCRTGAPLEELLAHDRSNRTSPDIAFVLQSLVAAAAGGTGTAHALERAAWVLRERHVVREERRVHAAQSVLSARVMSWMPIGFGVVMLLSSPSVRNVVLLSPLGIACVAVGTGLNVLGRRWMGRITGAFA